MSQRDFSEFMIYIYKNVLIILLAYVIHLKNLFIFLIHLFIIKGLKDLFIFYLIYLKIYHFINHILNNLDYV